ncbi:MAG: flagellar hook-length control protein FliK [Gemmataceae bacterium]
MSPLQEQGRVGFNLDAGSSSELSSLEEDSLRFGSSLRDEIELSPASETMPLPDESDGLGLKGLQASDEPGTELQTTAEKKKEEPDDVESVGEAHAEDNPVHGLSHSESVHPMHPSEPKPGREAHSVAEQVRDRIADHVETAREHGRVELSFDLHPPELGRMRLNLTSQDHSLNVRLWAENDQTRQLLANQMDALKERLAQGGVSLGSLNVGRDGGGARLPYKPPESFFQSASSLPAEDASRSIARFRWAAGIGAVDVMA